MSTAKQAFIVAIIWCAATCNSGLAQNSITRQQVAEYLKIQGLLHPDEKWDLADFDARVGEKDTYTTDELNGFKPLKVQVRSVDSVESNRALFGKLHSQGMKIRSSYSDVLSIENPTAADAKDKASDLTGALLSYTRDSKADSDTWAAKGALLWPFTSKQDVDFVTMQIQSAGIIPSVSFEKVTNSTDDTKNVDSLIFRVGVYAVATGVGPFTSLTFRAFGAYGTDFNFRSKTPAVEFELEPAYTDNRFFGIGRRVGLWRIPNPDATSGEPGTASITLINYRLRAYLHAAYGRVADSGNKQGVTEQDFFRLGPNLELKFEKLFTDHLTLKIGYAHFTDIVGHSPNHGLLTVEPEYIFNPNDRSATTLTKPVISLKASYQNGGVDLTNEKVRTVYVGLGISL